MKLKAFLLLCALALLPAAPAAAAEVYEVHYVPSVGGALIRVEILRNNSFDAAGQPVLLTYSPYNVLGGRSPANDSLASRFVRRGYARAVADVIGTRGSTGCWDYGGLAEQQSGVDVVKYLANLPWSNGNVGMIGVSYDGTTANMVAATGIPELKAVVPVAAISHWYGYAYFDGVRYFGNSREPADEGFDTPLLFDAGFAKTVAPDPAGAHFAETVVARAGECGAVEHTAQAYSRSPDYTDFWRARDYRKDAARFRAAVLLVHGWQDYNVKQDEAISLWEAIPVDDPATAEVEGVPFKKLSMSQESHSDGAGPHYQGLLERFLARTLRNEINGLEDEPDVYSLGRDADGAFTTYERDDAWPPVSTGTLALHLGRSFDEIDGVPSAGPVGTSGESGTLTLAPNDDGGGWTHVNPGTISEELTLQDPLNEDGHGYYSLYHRSEPLRRDVRIAGSAVLDAYVNSSTPGQHLTPILVDVRPDGTLDLIERGFLNLDYAGGLERAAPDTGWIHAQVRFLPQDYTVRAGHRIGVILQGSNTVWAVPGNPGVLSYANGPVPGVTGIGTRLLLPVVDLPGDPGELLPH